MDPRLIYAKTPLGDEAVRQSTRVVQRNLRMVLVQVDGKMSVDELTAKIGNPRLVESALRELEEGGYIASAFEAASVWEEKEDTLSIEATAMSEFSSFGQKTSAFPHSVKNESKASAFSSFGKPILPASSRHPGESLRPDTVPERGVDPEVRSDRSGKSSRSKAPLLAVAVLGTLAATVLFYPYEQFKPALEASATRMLKAPVKIDKVGLSLFPSPSLKLSGVRIGETAEGQLAEVRIASPLSLLGSGPHQVRRVAVSDASLTANLLVSLPMFTGDAADHGLVVRKLVVEHSQVVLGESLALSDLFGEVAFRSDGVIEKASFETGDRSLLIDALPSKQGVALNIEGRAWKPGESSVVFASLQAKGLLQKNKLLIQDLDTTFLGGILRGNWLLDWSNGLAMAGEGSLSRLDSSKVSAAIVPSLKIEGDMSGTIRLRSSGGDWESLWRNGEAALSTEITHGVLTGVDLGEASRRGSGSEVRAGATKFDRLRATLNITPKQVVGRDVRLDAGMMTVTGQFVAGHNGQVEGSMAVSLQSSVASQHASIRIYGSLPNLTAAAQ